MNDTEWADWALLLDPAWTPDTPQTAPPPTAIVGGWRIEPDGRAGPFHPNPDYLPSGPEVPTDPTHAVLRLVLRGETDVEELVDAVHDSLLEVAVTTEGELVLADSPDGVPCALVATSPLHARQELAEQWWQASIEEILAVLPPRTDVLLNPGAPESIRLIATHLTGR